MVADEVAVTSRSYRPDAQAWRWVSNGGSRFTLTPAERRAARHDGGDQAQGRQSADRVSSPPPGGWSKSSSATRTTCPSRSTSKDRIANQQSALWRKPMKDVQAGEYDDFYRQLTLDSEGPLVHVHIITDAPVDIRSILYVPRSLERTPLATRSEYGPAALLAQGPDPGAQQGPAAGVPALCRGRGRFGGHCRSTSRVRRCRATG